MIVRGLRPGDEVAVRRICVATGDAGEHARNILREPELMAHVFASPYLLLQPELCFLAESSGQPLGYVVAALDSVEFYRRWEREFSPCFARGHPAPPLGGGWDESARADDADEQLRLLLHRPRTMLLPDTDVYPSHLHINVLSGARRMGAGKALLRALFDALAAAGSPGVQLGVRATNASAHAFYRAMGMTRLPLDEGPAIRFGRPLGR
ncbi:GNAT family N-acetyltransferase [Actinopolyspora saharensis]|uniref:Acetyltransferase (GNAT) family protein n=1 Tax=Actinopolyspora saharensis TaxID=995062 RepID=A0A1H1DDP0_9ACTN|nr:GNAT family N-acetyltransferase [Actinopolyspora saharensis]SDQ74338.1 Acetyltransferase (GNAT) family protein [Actinopolyspora saharensis]